jgi:hypothetical protein
MINKIKIKKIFFLSILFFIARCKSDVDPICWCGKESGTIIPTPFCSPNPYNALLVLDSNPSDTLMVINNIPKKYLKDPIRVKVNYRKVEPKNALIIQCVSYVYYIKITCISKE